MGSFLFISAPEIEWATLIKYESFSMVYFLMRVNPVLTISNVISWLPFVRVLFEFKTKLS